MRRMPSLAALLGLVAVAGYQNRDKIGEFVKNMTGPGGGAGVAEGVKKTLGDGPLATSISGGLGELVDHFTKNGQGDATASWVGKGPNAPISGSQLEKTLGADLLDTLVKQTGLTKEELLSRLAKTLPETT